MAVYKSLNKGQANGQKAEAPVNGVKKNKQKVLMLSSRGVTYRHRHLLNDLATLLPHAKKDAKFDSKTRLHELNELAELYSCNNVLFFEARKSKDLYLHLSKSPNGPTVKMHLENLHTMDELQFSGNCLRGSRPVLSFDLAFENEPHLQVIKELFTHVFGVPQGARKSKPFIDRVMGFSVADDKVWVRNYQISEVEATGADGEGNKDQGAEDDETTKASKKAASKARGGLKDTDIKLVEIGPRIDTDIPNSFVLTPIIIQEASFGGKILYSNKQFVSPNQVRADLRKKVAVKHNSRAEQTVGRLARKGDLGLRTKGGRKAGKGALDNKSLFA